MNKAAQLSARLEQVDVIEGMKIIEEWSEMHNKSFKRDLRISAAT
jgi:hypothetical protein